jgi:Ala-tRNA(Pro) deacylase
MYIIDFLRNRGARHEVLLYRPAWSATKRAANAHIPGRKVAKAVLVKAGDAFVLAVLPSTSGVDLARLSTIVGMPVAHLRLATLAEVVATFSDCEPGVVPPFGHLYGLKTFVDLELSASPEIVVAGNTRHEGLKMRFDDFRALEEPILASFAQTLGSTRHQPKRFGHDRMVG